MTIQQVWQAPAILLELLLRWLLILVCLPFWAVLMGVITVLIWHRQRRMKGGPLRMEALER